MKKINWDVAKEKVKGSLDGVGDSQVSQKFMAIGQKLVKIIKRK